jgi:hypothetical protein
LPQSPHRRASPRPNALIEEVRFARDSPLEGSGFELPVPRCALIANSAALGRAACGGEGRLLNGRLTTPIGGGPATARLTRREDRDAALEDLSYRGDEPHRLAARTSARHDVMMIGGKYAIELSRERERETVLRELVHNLPREIREKAMRATYTEPSQADPE